MINAHDPDRLRDALHAIPPDLSREMWVKAGMAFHAGGGTGCNTTSSCRSGHKRRA